MLVLLKPERRQEKQRSYGQAKQYNSQPESGKFLHRSRGSLPQPAAKVCDKNEALLI